MNNIRKLLQNKILAIIYYENNKVIEQLVPIIESSITVHNVRYPIQTRNAFKLEKVRGKEEYYIPTVFLNHKYYLFEHTKTFTTPTGINDNNLYFTRRTFKDANIEKTLG